jgi:hypothetical protein
MDIALYIAVIYNKVTMHIFVYLSWTDYFEILFGVQLLVTEQSSFIHN